MDKQKIEQLDGPVPLTYKGRDFYVQTESYPEAVKWLEHELTVTGGKIDEILPSIGEGEEPVLLQSVPVEGEMVATAEELKDRLMKGYDYNTDCYVLTVVDVNFTSGQTAVSKRMSFGCNEEQRVVIDGTVVPIRTEEDLEREMVRQYPDKMRVLLEEESFERLLEFKEWNDEKEPIKLLGMIDAGKGVRMAGANGTLQTELVLSPEDYDYLDACDATYYSGELSELDFDAGVNATSMLLASEESLKEARIETYVCPGLLDNMVIEGVPYRELMELVKEYGISDERQLHYMLDERMLREQPEWKVKMAKEVTRSATDKFFVEKAAPAFHLQKKMYNETLETAAKENGYDSAADYNRDVQWTKDPSPQLQDKMLKTRNRWIELYTPYEKKSNDVFFQLECLKSKEARQFIEKFDRKAHEMVSDIKVVQRPNGKWYLNAKLDGVQQMGHEMKADAVEMLQKSQNKSEVIRQMAAKVFKDDIVEAMQQKTGRELGR